MLIIGTLTELGIPVDAKQGPTTIALYTFPIAFLALIIGIIQFRLNEKRRQRMHEALESKGGK